LHFEFTSYAKPLFAAGKPEGLIGDEFLDSVCTPNGCLTLKKNADASASSAQETGKERINTDIAF